MLQQNFYPGKIIQLMDGGKGGTSSANDADIPNPSYLVGGSLGVTTVGATLAKVIDAAATFQDDLDANKFAIGDTVYQTTTYKHSRIVSVDSQTQLTVFDADFLPAVGAGITYQIYRKSPYGCLIFGYFNKPNTNTIHVTDLNNNEFTLPAFATSMGHGQGILPFQCRKLIITNTDTFFPVLGLFQ
tara:strand:- start:140 stop:697 length:558 start_codon:yes stop_codon:yes gene_type:complete